MWFKRHSALPRTTSILASTLLGFQQQPRAKNLNSAGGLNVVLILAITLILALVLATNTVAAKKDAAKETAPLQAPPTPAERHRMAMETLANALDSNEALWLGSDNTTFLALQRADQSGKNLGGVLLLAAPGHHADWPEIIGPLRRQLTQHGWHSLSINPLLPPSPTPLYIQASESDPDGDNSSTSIDDTPAAASQPQQIDTRIQAGIEQLRGKGGNLLLLGRGESAYQLLRFAQQQPAGINGIILIDPQTPAQANAPLAQLIGQINLPLLDLYYPDNQALAQRRLVAARGNQAGSYRGVRLSTPRGYPLPDSSLLLRQIVGWGKQR